MYRIDLCSILSVPPYGDISRKFGMIWRFLPLADPFVDFMVSIDLDSRYTSIGILMHGIVRNSFHIAQNSGKLCSITKK